MDLGNKKKQIQFGSIFIAPETLFLSVKIDFHLLLVMIMEIMSASASATMRMTESHSHYNGSVISFVLQDAGNNTVTDGGF